MKVDPPEFEHDRASCLLSLSTERGLERLDFSANSLTVPDLIADLRAAIELFQWDNCASMLVSSPRESSATLGPSEVSRIPLAEAILDLDRSKRSTPNQERREQLSGPDIPGVQISEEGNLLLTASIASASLPPEFDSWGESVIAITEGCISDSTSEIS